MLALLDEALALGRRLMRPRALRRWLVVTGQDGDALHVEGRTLRIPGIGVRWGTVERIAVAVCTIGEALEARVRDLWDARELPLAAMLDSVGSVAAESLAERVHDILCREGTVAGIRVAGRTSPGHQDWDVSEQRTLFGLCPGTPVGVTLNEACVMTPAKSVSLLAGAGRQARVEPAGSPCARCRMARCAYRRMPPSRPAGQRRA